jgi:uncharacterized membrane protein YjjB (DUF3815 family)
MGKSTLSKLATGDFGMSAGIVVGGVLAWLTLALLGPHVGKTETVAAAIGVFLVSLVGTTVLLYRAAR